MNISGLNMYTVETSHMFEVISKFFQNMSAGLSPR